MHRMADVVCHKCNETGHRRNECPLNKIKKAPGIPKNRLEYVSSDTPNAMLTANGQYAIERQTT